jgi:hypothetical protein
MSEVFLFCCCCALDTCTPEQCETRAPTLGEAPEIETIDRVVVIVWVVDPDCTVCKYALTYRQGATYSQLSSSKLCAWHVPKTFKYAHSSSF